MQYKAERTEVHVSIWTLYFDIYFCFIYNIAALFLNSAIVSEITLLELIFMFNFKGCVHRLENN